MKFQFRPAPKYDLKKPTKEEAAATTEMVELLQVSAPEKKLDGTLVESVTDFK